jgi:hypothetical protein
MDEQQYKNCIFSDIGYRCAELSNKSLKFTFATLPVSCASYTFSVLSSRYLSSGHYKNDNFLKNGIPYLSSGRHKIIW